MKQINEIDYLSDEGMVFRQKETGIIYGWGISLGLNDTIDNYEEVDCPKEYKGNEAYDNTIKSGRYRKETEFQNNTILVILCQQIQMYF